MTIRTDAVGATMRSRSRAILGGYGLGALAVACALQACAGAAPPGYERALREACAPVPSCMGLSAVAFGADPTGARDSADAIQTAIKVAAGRPVLLPAGIYLLKKPLTFSSRPDAHDAGLTLLGEGQGVTTLRVGHEGPGIVVDQAPSGAYHFGRFGALAGFTLDGAGRSVGPGVRLTGAWRYLLEDLTVEGFLGTAVEVPWRADIHENPDGWQSDVRLSRVTLVRNGGWGIDSDAATGLLINADDLVVLENRKGGMRLSGGLRLVGGSVAYNGGPGLLIVRRPGGATPQLVDVERVEFDGNAGPHIDARAVAGLSARSSRFVSQVIDGGFQPRVAVTIGNEAPDTEGAVTDALFDTCVFRATPGEDWTAFDFRQRTSYAGVAIRRTHWLGLDPSTHLRLSARADAALVVMQE